MISYKQLAGNLDRDGGSDLMVEDELTNAINDNEDSRRTNRDETDIQQQKTLLYRVSRSASRRRAADSTAVFCLFLAYFCILTFGDFLPKVQPWLNFPTMKRSFGCVYSQWGTWSIPDSLTGVQTRRRQIYIRPRNGGTPCPPTKEFRQINGKKVDYLEAMALRFEKAFLSPSAMANLYTGRAEIKPRDVLFLVDMSGSLTEEQFAKTMSALAELVGKICGGVGQGPNENRVAVVTFDHRVRLDFKFDVHFTLQDVQRAIRAIKPMRGATCTGDALQFAAEQLYGDPSSGARPHGKSVKDVLVLTDGLSNCGADVAQMAAKLKVQSNVFGLLIGSYTYPGVTEIENLVSTPSNNHIFSLQYFNHFLEMVTRIMSPQNTFPCVPLVVDELRT